MNVSPKASIYIRPNKYISYTFGKMIHPGRWNHHFELGNHFQSDKETCAILFDWTVTSILLHRWIMPSKTLWSPSLSFWRIVKWLSYTNYIIDNWVYFKSLESNPPTSPPIQCSVLFVSEWKWLIPFVTQTSIQSRGWRFFSSGGLPVGEFTPYKDLSTNKTCVRHFKFEKSWSYFMSVEGKKERSIL